MPSASGREDEKKGWGWGQWRCPSEGHGRECGLRPSVQSGVPRCRARFFFLLLCLARSLSLSLSSVVRLAASPALTVGAQRRRLQECTKCIALTGVRPVPPASTCLLRTRSRAHACSSPVPWRSSSPPPSTLPCRALLPPRFTRTRTEKE